MQKLQLIFEGLLSLTTLLHNFFLPASRTLRAWPAGPKITSHFPRLLVNIFVRLHLSRAQ